MTTDQPLDARTIAAGDIVLCLAALTGVFGLKFWHRTASVDDLSWILWPTSTLVSLISCEPFSCIEGVGFRRWDELVVINKGCSGVNFLVMACSLALYAGMRMPGSLYRKIPAFVCSILMAYGLTIAANTTRILVAMAILEINARLPMPVNGDMLHLAAGIFVYLGFLIAFYLLIRRRSWRKNAWIF